MRALMKIGEGIKIHSEGGEITRMEGPEAIQPHIRYDVVPYAEGNRGTAQVIGEARTISGREIYDFVRDNKKFNRHYAQESLGVFQDG